MQEAALNFLLKDTWTPVGVDPAAFILKLKVDFSLLSLTYSSVTKVQHETGVDTSSGPQPQKTLSVQNWSSQSPASPTAPASHTSTESQVGPSVQPVQAASG